MRRIELTKNHKYILHTFWTLLILQNAKPTDCPFLRRIGVDKGKNIGNQENIPCECVDGLMLMETSL